METKDLAVKAGEVLGEAGIKELAEAVSDLKELAEPVVQKGCQLLGSLLGPGAKELGLFAGEYVHRWRTKNRIATLAQVSDRLKEKGVSPQIVPKGFLLPALEAIGDCEEPEIQKLWADLIANSVADDSDQSKAYVNALKSLSVSDARIFAEAAKRAPDRVLAHEFAIRAGTHHAGLPVSGGEPKTFATLKALGLFGTIPLMTEAGFEAGLSGDGGNMIRLVTVITPFGIDFGRAVGLIPPPTEPPH